MKKIFNFLFGDFGRAVVLVVSLVVTVVFLYEEAPWIYCSIIGFGFYVLGVIFVPVALKAFPDEPEASLSKRRLLAIVFGSFLSFFLAATSAVFVTILIKEYPGYMPEEEDAEIKAMCLSAIVPLLHILISVSYLAMTKDFSIGVSSLTKDQERYLHNFGYRGSSSR